MGGAAMVSFAPVLAAAAFALGAGQRHAGDARHQWRAFAALLTALSTAAIALCVVVGDGLLDLRHHTTLATLGLFVLLLATGTIVAVWLAHHRGDDEDDGGSETPDDAPPPGGPDWARFDELREGWSQRTPV